MYGYIQAHTCECAGKVACHNKAEEWKRKCNFNLEVQMHFVDKRLWCLLTEGDALRKHLQNLIFCLGVG